MSRPEPSFLLSAGVTQAVQRVLAVAFGNFLSPAFPNDWGCLALLNSVSGYSCPIPPPATYCLLFCTWTSVVSTTTSSYGRRLPYLLLPTSAPESHCNLVPFFPGFPAIGLHADVLQAFLEIEPYEHLPVRRSLSSTHCLPINTGNSCSRKVPFESRTVLTCFGLPQSLEASSRIMPQLAT